MTNPQYVNADWYPRFVDYFHLSFTTATAFSPTDTLPLTHWAKMLMLVEASASLLTLLLVHFILGGRHIQGHELIRAAIHIWCTTVLTFALWFWLLDSGGPAARARERTGRPDFLFTQMTNPELAPANWRPAFLDYLYLSFTNATAFSPTDTMPLTQWAKMLMLVEAAASLLTLLMVAARAVNILS